MAFEEKRINPRATMFTMLLALPLIVATDIDCNGRPFHCMNSTHFMICVDIGNGVSRTMDNYVLPCPEPTICDQNNDFECEFPVVSPSTPQGSLQDSFSTTPSTNLITVWSEETINTLSPITSSEFQYQSTTNDANLDAKNSTVSYKETTMEAFTKDTTLGSTTSSDGLELTNMVITDATIIGDTTSVTDLPTIITSIGSEEGGGIFTTLAPTKDFQNLQTSDYNTDRLIINTDTILTTTLPIKITTDIDNRDNSVTNTPASMTPQDMNTTGIIINEDIISKEPILSTTSSSDTSTEIIGMTNVIGSSSNDDLNFISATVNSDNISSDSIQSTHSSTTINNVAWANSITNTPGPMPFQQTKTSDTKINDNITSYEPILRITSPFEIASGITDVGSSASKNDLNIITSTVSYDNNLSDLDQSINSSTTINTDAWTNLITNTTGPMPLQDTQTSEANIIEDITSNQPIFGTTLTYERIPELIGITNAGSSISNRDMNFITSAVNNKKSLMGSADLPTTINTDAWTNRNTNTPRSIPPQDTQTSDTIIHEGIKSNEPILHTTPSDITTAIIGITDAGSLSSNNVVNLITATVNYVNTFSDPINSTDSLTTLNINTWPKPSTNIPVSMAHQYMQTSHTDINEDVTSNEPIFSTTSGSETTTDITDASRSSANNDMNFITDTVNDDNKFPDPTQSTESSATVIIDTQPKPNSNTFGPMSPQDTQSFDMSANEDIKSNRPGLRTTPSEATIEITDVGSSLYTNVVNLITVTVNDDETSPALIQTIDSSTIINNDSWVSPITNTPGSIPPQYMQTLHTDINEDITSNEPIFSTIAGSETTTDITDASRSSANNDLNFITDTVYEDNIFADSIQSTESSATVNIDAWLKPTSKTSGPMPPQDMQSFDMSTNEDIKSNEPGLRTTPSEATIGITDVGSSSYNNVVNLTTVRVNDKTSPDLIQTIDPSTVINNDSWVSLITNITGSIPPQYMQTLHTDINEDITSNKLIFSTIAGSETTTDITDASRSSANNDLNFITDTVYEDNIFADSIQSSESSATVNIDAWLKPTSKTSGPMPPQDMQSFDMSTNEDIKSNEPGLRTTPSEATIEITDVGSSLYTNVVNLITVTVNDDETSPALIQTIDSSTIINNDSWVSPITNTPGSIPPQYMQTLHTDINEDITSNEPIFSTIAGSETTTDITDASRSSANNDLNFITDTVYEDNIFADSIQSTESSATVNIDAWLKPTSKKSGPMPPQDMQSSDTIINEDITRNESILSKTPSETTIEIIGITDAGNSSSYNRMNHITDTPNYDNTSPDSVQSVDSPATINTNTWPKPIRNIPGAVSPQETETSATNIYKDITSKKPIWSTYFPSEIFTEIIGTADASSPSSNSAKSDNILNIPLFSEENTGSIYSIVDNVTTGSSIKREERDSIDLSENKSKQARNFSTNDQITFYKALHPSNKNSKVHISSYDHSITPTLLPSISTEVFKDGMTSDTPFESKKYNDVFNEPIMSNSDTAKNTNDLPIIKANHEFQRPILSMSNSSTKILTNESHPVTELSPEPLININILNISTTSDDVLDTSSTNEPKTITKYIYDTSLSSVHNRYAWNMAARSNENNIGVSKNISNQNLFSAIASNPLKYTNNFINNSLLNSLNIPEIREISRLEDNSKPNTSILIQNATTTTNVSLDSVLIKDETEETDSIKPLLPDILNNKSTKSLSTNKPVSVTSSYLEILTKSKVASKIFTMLENNKTMLENRDITTTTPIYKETFTTNKKTIDTEATTPKIHTNFNILKESSNKGVFKIDESKLSLDSDPFKNIDENSKLNSSTNLTAKTMTTTYVPQTNIESHASTEVYKKNPALTVYNKKENGASLIFSLPSLEIKNINIPLPTKTISVTTHKPIVMLLTELKRETDTISLNILSNNSSLTKSHDKNKYESPTNHQLHDNKSNINITSSYNTSNNRPISSVIGIKSELKLKYLTSTVNRTNVKALNFKCPHHKRGRYADNNDCRKFYTCIGRWEPIAGICPLNTVFSEIWKQCTNNLSHCVRNHQFRCTSEGRFSDVLLDSVYYICIKSGNDSLYRIKLKCSDGFYLNKTTVKCEKNEAMSGESDTVSKSSTTATVETENSSNSEFKCRNEGSFADPNDCRSYYICKKRNKSQFRRKRKKCESDELFHKEEKKCVDADSYEC